ncbi:MAG TPA: hypothetical protein VNS63_27205, partial [Blastocatellia bacterium]|nr:hypothetical protein [Blastocatellia bacterium]
KYDLLKRERRLKIRLCAEAPAKRAKACSPGQVHAALGNQNLTGPQAREAAKACSPGQVRAALGNANLDGPRAREAGDRILVDWNSLPPAARAQTFLP